MQSALEGIRILDFGIAWAGPYSSELLGFLGAEVTKIETRKRLDSNRERSDAMGGEAADVEVSVMFHDANMDKMGVTIDLTTDRGKELARGLVKVSDVVLENFRPGVMEKLGFGYEELKKLRPDVIMVSVSACGQTGPARSYAGYATIFNALSGLAEMSGYHDGPPLEIRTGVDLRVGTTVAFAILSALHHRMATGRGQRVDVSAWEAISSLIGDRIVGYSMNQKPYERTGNKDAFMAPHNYYRCKGDDKWVSIAAGNEAEWHSLCKAMGTPGLAADKRFANLAARKNNEAELDALIGKWTSSRTPYEVTSILQKASVAAFPVMSSPDFFDDPHLKARKVWVPVKHARMGKRIVVAPPWKLSGTPARVHRPAPLMGEHNQYMFHELLGEPAEEVERLVAEGVLR